MTNLNIRFLFALVFVITLALVLASLDQSLSNDILMSVLDYNNTQINSLMQEFKLEIVAQNSWGNVSCSDLNQLSGSTEIDFSDKALVLKLEVCHNYK